MAKASDQARLDHALAWVVTVVPAVGSCAALGAVVGRRRPGGGRSDHRSTSTGSRSGVSIRTGPATRDRPRLALPAAHAAVLCAQLRTAITPTYGLTVSGIALTRLGTVPKTSSGKIRRAVCRDLYLAGELPLLGGWRRGVSTNVE